MTVFGRRSRGVIVVGCLLLQSHRWTRVYAHKAPAASSSVRTDFTETVLFVAGINMSAVSTSAQSSDAVVVVAPGHVRAHFTLPQSVTTMRVCADTVTDRVPLPLQEESEGLDPGVSQQRVLERPKYRAMFGANTRPIRVRKPQYIEAKLPHLLTGMDAVQVPITLVNNAAHSAQVHVVVSVPPPLHVWLPDTTEASTEVALSLGMTAGSRTSRSVWLAVNPDANYTFTDKGNALRTSAPTFEVNVDAKFTSAGRVTPMGVRRATKVVPAFNPFEWSSSGLLGPNASTSFALELPPMAQSGMCMKWCGAVLAHGIAVSHGPCRRTGLPDPSLHCSTVAGGNSSCALFAC